jgi:hypothetical protein
MTGVGHGGNIAIARKLPRSRYRTAVDIGTVQGDLITQVAVANCAQLENLQPSWALHTKFPGNHYTAYTHHLYTV